MRRTAPMRWLAGCVVMGAAGVAGAQQPSAGGFIVGPVGAAGAGPRESHAWMAIALDGPPGTALLHVPPRGSDQTGRMAPDGTVCLARQLGPTPAVSALAAWGNEAYIVLEPDVGPLGVRQRRVLVADAEPSPLGDLWYYGTSGSRLNTLPALPGDGVLRGVAGSDFGPVALIQEVEEPRTVLARYRLLVLVGAEWRAVAPPEDWSRGGVEAMRGPARLVALARGVGVLVQGAEGSGLWRGRVEFKGPVPVVLPEDPDAPIAVPEQPRPEVLWEWEALDFGDSPPNGPVFMVDGHVVWCRRDAAGVLTVWGTGAGGAQVLARLEGVGEDYAAAPLEQGARLVVLWPDAARAPGTPVAGQCQAREVSVATGRVLYSGLAKNAGPVSAREYRMLAVLLVGVLVVIVLFVVRPEARTEVHLPEGMALARGGRRMLATGIDAALALTLAVNLTGTTVEEVTTLKGIVASGQGVWGLLALLGIAWAHGTIGEWLFGRTIGKAVAGCRVVRAGIERGADGTLSIVARRPTLGRAAVRNMVKWFVPPIAMEALSSPDRRHRGDTWAGTVVVE